MKIYATWAGQLFPKLRKSDGSYNITRWIIGCTYLAAGINRDWV